MRAPAAVTFLAVVAALYWGREVLVPAALAVMIAFLLAPVVRRLERIRIPRVPAVLVTVGAVTLFLGGVGWLVELEVVDLAGRLPEYKANILEKVRSVRPTLSGVVGPGGLFSELGQELAAPHTGGLDPSAADPTASPTPVRVVAEPTPPLTYLREWLGPMLSRLATVGIAIVLASFMLIYREDLRSRLVRLIGERRIHVTTPALDDAAQGVSRYLLMQLIVNASSGLLIGLGMHLIGIPNAALWGLVIAILKFIPYVGVWIGAALPLTLSLALSPGWSQPLSALGLILAVELIAANVAEPLLFASRTGLSPLAVLGSAVFWAWLWGPAGLLLSTPMAVCLAVLGKHVPGLRFFEILLGDKPVLTPEAQLYQRVLAGDHDESVALLKAATKDNPAAIFDSLLIPTLRLAEQHRDHAELDEAQEAVVMDSLDTYIEDALPEADAIAPHKDAPLIMCIAASDRADELAAKMVERTLATRGVASRTISSDAMIGEIIEQVAQSAPAAVCISAIPPGSVTHARVLCKRLRARRPELTIVVGIWDESADEGRTREEFGTSVTDHVVTTIIRAADKLQSLAGSTLAVAKAG